jgi:hypothetical protein
VLTLGALCDHREVSPATSRINPAPVRMRLVGGANVPTSHLRINGTFPFGLLVISDEYLTVRLRPSWFGAVPLVATPADLRDVFPIRRAIGPWGLGFRTPDGREWYFWSTKAASRAALELLARLGYPVSWTAKRPAKVWNATP